MALIIFGTFSDLFQRLRFVGRKICFLAALLIENKWILP